MKSYLKQALFLFILAGSLTAQDFSGIKIYINPGHGGHDSDDRYISSTGYWESEGNLTKGLYLRDLLENLGATVIMSRTQNRSIDDRSLSEIDAEANANNVDYFHSIHSNAHNETVNYPLVLFRGTDSNPVFSQAKTMGSIIWNQLKNIPGNIAFYSYKREICCICWSRNVINSNTITIFSINSEEEMTFKMVFLGKICIIWNKLYICCLIKCSIFKIILNQISCIKSIIRFISK